MKFVCSKQDLNEAITTVQRAVMTKATLPILEGIFINASDKVKLVGNCFDLGIECTISADIRETGSIVLNSKMFGEIVRRLPDNEVFFEVKENYVVVIESGNSYFEIKGLSPEGFPMLPEIDEENKIYITQSTLKDMIRKTNYAISTDENRKILTGSLIESSQGDLTMVSLDGFRMAIAKALINSNVDFKAVIPGKNLMEILKILDQTDKEISITLSKNQVLFEFEHCRVISKLLDGEYMSYRNFIPEQFETSIETNVSELEQSIERASLITNEDKRYPVKFIIQDDKMVVTSSAEIGISKEEIDVKQDGNNMTIGFNPRYMLDSLKVIEDEKVIISFSSSIGPSVIKPVEGDKFLFMVLPVRMK